MSYVRWTLNKMVSNQGVSDAMINDIEIHDISKGSEDTWAVVGLGQSRSTYHGHPGLFPELIHGAHPDYYPALIDLAEAGGQAKDLVSDIDVLLKLNPDFHFWILAYGVGDAEDNRTPAQTEFKTSMQKVIDKLKAAGKVPLLPRIEKLADAAHTTIDQFNKVIDELVAANDLPPAPDLYPLFSAKPELLCSTDCEEGHVGIDFSPAGEAAVNQLWATTLDPLYAP
jgi:acyl-CoA thioesterase-1